jgi:hypothetical protein
MNLDTPSITNKTLNGSATNPMPHKEAKGFSPDLTADLAKDLYQSIREQSRDLVGRAVRFARKNPAVSAAAVTAVGIVVARMIARSTATREKHHR